MTHDMFCDPTCKHLSPTEEEQSVMLRKISHQCKKYKIPLNHGDFHPNLIRLWACVHDEET